MFKRLAPVLELPESRSESESPEHKRSQTQHRSRVPNSPQNSDLQVWMIIQSRRNLDKKIRTIHRKNKKDKENCIRSTVCNTAESPCNKSFDGKGFKSEREKVNVQRVRKGKSTENKEKMIEKTQRARIEVKMQSALDLEYVKKRDEYLIQQKKEKVNLIKNSLKHLKHKRTASSNALKDLNSSEYLLKIQKMNENNLAAENSLQKLKLKEEFLLGKLQSTSECKENLNKTLPDRSFSGLISPQRSSF